MGHAITARLLAGTYNYCTFMSRDTQLLHVFPKITREGVFVDQNGAKTPSLISGARNLDFRSRRGGVLARVSVVAHVLLHGVQRVS